jgi:dihydrolipoamide dehydrogenase
VQRVDVVIVGAGTAGLGALREVRKQTESFVLINDGPWGTMCARVGCMPSKALIEAANAYHRRKDLAAFGVLGGEKLTVDGVAVLERVRKTRDAMVEEVCELTAGLGERAISGRARLLGSHRVMVAGREIAASRIILATGSRPAVPEKWRPLAGHLLTTDSLFEQKTFPKRVAVLGLGPLGVELAQALARLGSDVTAFESKTRIAGLADERISQALLDVLRGELAVHLGHEVELSADGERVRVTAKTAGASAVVDRVLVALGRKPNLEGLGLETLGVPLDEHGKPEVDPTTMQVGQLPVFLVGDAAGDRPRQHEAADEGHIAGLNACAPSMAKYERRVPLGIVFTDPSVAIVGKTSSDLEDDSEVVGEAGFADQGRSRLGLRGPGRLRIRADKATGAIVGAELCAPDGEHLGHLLALAIARGSSVKEMLQAPFYHPCLEEGVRTALRDAGKKLEDEAFELDVARKS